MNLPNKRCVSQGVLFFENNKISKSLCKCATIYLYQLTSNHKMFLKVALQQLWYSESKHL